MSASAEVHDPSVTGPLSGIRVADISNFLAGPTAAMWLGDFGADVVKLEHPRGDGQRDWGRKKDGNPLFFKVVARNKRCSTLDLSAPAGQEIFRRVVKHMDVVVENFRPGTMAKWGIGPSTLLEINPRLIILSISAYGQNGPYALRPGLGTLAEALSGYAHITGQQDGPPTLPAFGLADSIAGLTGAFAVLAALRYRDQTGIGQHIDTSLFEPLMTLLGPQFIEYDQLGVIAGRLGSRLPFSAPRNLYKTKDDLWLAMSSTAQSIYERTMKVIGKPELITDPRFATNAARSQNVEDLDAEIGEWVSQHTLNEAMSVLVPAGAAAAPVYDFAQIFEDEHIKARESLTLVSDPDLGEVRMQNVTPRMTRSPGQIRFTGRHLGEDNEEFYLGTCGMDAEEYEQLRQDKVI